MAFVSIATAIAFECLLIIDAAVLHDEEALLTLLSNDDYGVFRSHRLEVSRL